jgi:hypothetical protein
MFLTRLKPFSLKTPLQPCFSITDQPKVDNAQVRSKGPIAERRQVYRALYIEIHTLQASSYNLCEVALVAIRQPFYFAL